MDQTLSELFSNKSLRFIFVGGKGGVGKTTTASSIALALSQSRGKTLIISTDPAHNLSDAFNQQFSHEPTPVQDAPNLFAMEINPKKMIEMTSSQFFEQSALLQNQSLNASAVQQLFSAFPGIDEAVVFIKLIEMSKQMAFEIVVFDTAPTGHTLKLLSLPSTLNNVLGAVASFKEKVNGVLSVFGAQSEEQVGSLFAKMADVKLATEKLKEVLTDPTQTTFVAVCIPEFLSVYETERLVQELAVQNIDIYNVVVNQIVFFDEKQDCRKCKARFAMQLKYINQIFQLYSDFHVVLMPLEDEEIRGVPALKEYGKKLAVEKKLPQL